MTGVPVGGIDVTGVPVGGMDVTGVPVGCKPHLRCRVCVFCSMSSIKDLTMLPLPLLSSLFLQNLGLSFQFNGFLFQTCIYCLQ